MAISSHSLALFLTIIFSTVILHCSSSSSIASEQLKFWSQNVQTPMPNSILKKLSPHTKKVSDYYTNIILSTPNQFTADAHFCSLANLACTSEFDKAMKVSKSYHSSLSNTYGAQSSDALRHEDPFSFFRQSVLRKGNLLHLPNLQESLPNRAFLPTQIVSKIPLTHEAIFKTFPGSSVGTTKETVQYTLSSCNAAAIQGETKGCPKTLEDMVGFAKSTLGDKNLWALTSMISPEGLMIITKMKQYPVEKIVACHEAFLPFATYFCHSLPSTRLYAVELVDPNKELGGSVNTMMLAICHMDTSSWPKNHVAFRTLKFGPGQGEACHWFTQLDLAWISM